MQAELPQVSIIGVNEEGYGDANEAFCEGRDLPWLQDTGADGMWQTWGVAYRDVYIVDGDGTLLDVYNLTTYNLAVHYDGLKELLSDYASAL